jgi:hypothetical protein
MHVEKPLTRLANKGIFKRNLVEEHDDINKLKKSNDRSSSDAAFYR